MHLSRRSFLASSAIAGISTFSISPRTLSGEEPQDAGYSKELGVAARLFDGKQCWVHPRAGIVPGAGRDDAPRVVMTMNTLDLDCSDVFKAMYDLHTDDLGKSWTEPRQRLALAPRTEVIEGVERPVSASDFWPTWHAASKTLLGTGHSIVYTPDWKVVPNRPRHTVYATYNATRDDWSPWRKLQMPAGPKFAKAGAGCTQRVDESDGTILLPFYFQPPDSNSQVSVMRCSFDGRELRYLEHGDELRVEDATRGIGEPSLVTHQGRYYLTIRHNQRAYVTRSDDGLHFEPLQSWKFDDGADLGSYNTQAHWVAHTDALFLVYTRRGLDNDHVFRHRAPLVMAQVDPDRLCVIRATEQPLVPERGARLGNFGVTHVSPKETWVTVAEWMQPRGCEKHGSDGSVYVARIRWKRPNQSA